MATITMDSSEYELMKENKKLLEASLEKERELQMQIEQLNKEKIAAYEDAKMKVVKISRTEITEHTLRKRSDNDIWREILHIIRNDPNAFNRMPDYFQMDQWVKAVFDTTTMTSYPIETTTTHGLDDIKIEIREDLKSQMDSDAKRKIQEADEAIVQKDKLVQENKQLERNNGSLVGKNKALVDQCELLAEKHDAIVKALAESENKAKAFDAIKDILKDGYGFWNKSELLDKIISIEI